MKRTLFLFVSFALFASDSWAASTCAAPRDITALKTADLQQFLMVAALTCNKVAAYNSFVTSHQAELQTSDKALLKYFMGRNAQTGDADYNAFKTSLANAASLRSLHDAAFCSAADALYTATTSGPVANTVSHEPPPIKLIYTSCARDEIQLAESGALDLR